MIQLLPLPKLPVLKEGSPELVKVLDKIRFDLEKREESDKYNEFCWFAREYPRCYRYYLDCADYRLQSIYQRYENFYREMSDKLIELNENSFGIYHSNKEIIVIYWDFEAFLSSVSTALDLLARIVGTNYREQTPPSFNKLCNKDLDGPVQIMKEAQKRWVSKMKDYRDCFVHYTPVDTQLGIMANKYSNGWEIRCKLPVNPNFRDILGFKYNRRIELLKYAISVYKNMNYLDRSIASNILTVYKKGFFPVRINNLFFLGKRTRTD